MIRWLKYSIMLGRVLQPEILNSLCSPFTTWSLYSWKSESAFCASIISLLKLSTIINWFRQILLGSTDTKMFRFLNSSNSSYSLTMREETCRNFLLSASATTFAFPGWYLTSKSYNLLEIWPIFSVLGSVLSD